MQPTFASHTPESAKPAPTDAELLARVMRGDERALAALRQRYERLVYAIALRITHDHMVAEEVVQDVMLAIWQSAARFRVGGSVAAWLTGIARHRAIDATRTHCSRARAREQALDAGGAEPGGADDHADALTLHQVLSSALDQLSPKQREGIALAYYAGLTHDEIAQRLGKPLGTVKSRIHLGLVQLRRIMHTADW